MSFSDKKRKKALQISTKAFERKLSKREVATLIYQCFVLGSREAQDEKFATFDEVMSLWSLVHYSYFNRPLENMEVPYPCIPLTCQMVDLLVEIRKNTICASK